jgi:hypothetical protein
MLIPPPVVVDADVLLRNIEYAVRKGYAGALLGQAGGRYTLTSGVVLFAATEVGREAIRHLPDVAKRQGVSQHAVRTVWNDIIVPNIRFVEVSPEDVDDPRIAGVHPKDVPTAVLASLLAPAVIATDNRKDLSSFDLPETKTDAVARDLFALGRFGTGVKGVALFPTLAGAATIEGSKKVIAKLGSDAAVVIGLLILGGAVVFLISDRGRVLRTSLADVARKAGPPLAELIADATAAGERVGAFAIDRFGEPDALAVVASRLAVGQSVMTTRQVADELRLHGFRFEGGRAPQTETRA